MYVRLSIVFSQCQESSAFIKCYTPWTQVITGKRWEANMLISSELFNITAVVRLQVESYLINIIT